MSTLTPTDAARAPLSSSPKPRPYAAAPAAPPPGPRRGAWVHAAAAAVAFGLGLVGTLAVLGAAPATALHTGPALRAVPPPPARPGAAGRPAPPPRLWSALRAPAPAPTLAGPPPRAPPPRPPAPQEEALAAATAALDDALDRAEPILVYILEDAAKDMDLDKARRALRVVDDLVARRKAAVGAAADPAQARAMVEHAELERLLVDDVVSAMLRKREAEQGPAPAPAPAAAEGARDPQAAVAAARAAVAKTLDRAEALLRFFLKDEARAVDLEKAQRALGLVEALVRERKAEAAGAADAAHALAMVEHAERERAVVRDVVLAMLRLRDAERALAGGRAAAAAPRDGDAGAVEAAGAGAGTAEDAAVEKAVEKAEVILQWVLGDDAAEMDLPKAQRALRLIDDFLAKRRAAAAVAADPVHALALVAKAERKQVLVQNVVTAMLLRADAERARAPAPAPAPVPAPAGPGTNLADPRAALRAARVALDGALDKAQMTLTFLLGPAARDMDVAKAKEAARLMAGRVAERTAAARGAADPLRALALAEKELRQQLLVNNVLAAMLLREECEQALDVAEGRAPDAAVVAAAAPAAAEVAKAGAGGRSGFERGVSKIYDWWNNDRWGRGRKGKKGKGRNKRGSMWPF